MLDLDEAIGEVGAFGICQIIFVATAAVFMTLLGANMTSSIFEGLVPETRCKSPVEEEVILACPADFQNILVPEIEGRLSHCLRYNFSDARSALFSVTDVNGSSPSCNITGNQTSENIVPCTEWEYDRSIMGSTIVSEFNLVCKDQWAGYFSQSALMLGVGIGGILAGYISDKIGRRHAFLIASLGSAIIGTAVSFTSSYAEYSIVRALFGVFMYAPFPVLFVHASELTLPKYRSVVAQVLELSFPFGFMMLSALAFGLRDWRKLQLTISVPFVTCILFWWFAPESPRWLSEKNRNQEALEVLRRIARINRIKDVSPSEKSDGDEKEKEADETKTEFEEKTSVVQFFKTPNLRSVTLKMLYNWFASSCVYYALTLNAADFDGDPFRNVVINSAAEIVAVIITIPLANFYGRRLTNSGSNILTGIACILVALLPEGAKLAVATVGKFGISISFSVMYIHTNEIYPTVIRNLGVGLCCCMARVGNILSPIISIVGLSAPQAPYIIFGIFSIAAGILILTLPETGGTNLPQTIKEGESFIAADRGILRKILFPWKRKKKYRPERNTEIPSATKI